MSHPDQIRAREARAEESREAKRAARENSVGGVVIHVQRPTGGR